MPFSLRLDPETEAALRRLARATGLSRSVIVREAVAQYGTEKANAVTPPDSALDRVRPFAGIVSSGGQYSTDTHTKYRAALRRKQRARRSR
jgi:predicted DNA-binding protein